MQAATLTGLIAIIIWGASLPITRLLQEQVGMLALAGIVNAAAGMLGILRLRLMRQPLPSRLVFKNSRLYLRWFFFLLHTLSIITAIYIVQRHNVPFVLLVNYIWPTAIIVFSVLLAGVQITRWWAFIAGSMVVLASLGMEIVGPDGFSWHLFESPTDCLAYVIAFIGALAWGLYSALSRRDGEATGGSSVIPFFQLTVGLALPLAFMTDQVDFSGLTFWWGMVIVAQCLATMVAYLTWDFGMRKGNVVALSLFADFIPWVSLTAAWLLLQTPITTTTVLSAVTLVAGAMLTRYGTLRRRQPKALADQHVVD